MTTSLGYTWNLLRHKAAPPKYTQAREKRSATSAAPLCNSWLTDVMQPSVPETLRSASHGRMLETRLARRQDVAPAQRDHKAELCP